MRDYCLANPTCRFRYSPEVFPRNVRSAIRIRDFVAGKEKKTKVGNSVTAPAGQGYLYEASHIRPVNEQALRDIWSMMPTFGELVDVCWFFSDVY